VKWLTLHWDVERRATHYIVERLFTVYVDMFSVDISVLLAGANLRLLVQGSTLEASRGRSRRVFKPRAGFTSRSAECKKRLSKLSLLVNTEYIGIT
jgi:hypothetical protein